MKKIVVILGVVKDLSRDHKKLPAPSLLALFLFWDHIFEPRGALAPPIQALPHSRFVYSCNPNPFSNLHTLQRMMRVNPFSSRNACHPPRRPSHKIHVAATLQ